MTWGEAFAVTLVIEIPVYVACLVMVVGTPWRTSGVVGASVNAISHPLLWFALLPALDAVFSAPAALLAAEAIVALGEWGGAVAALRRDWFVIAATVLLANGLSFLAGVLLQS